MPAGRRKLDAGVKQSRILSVRVDDETFHELNLLISKNNKDFKSYGDVFRQSFEALKRNKSKQQKANFAKLF